MLLTRDVNRVNRESTSGNKITDRTHAAKNLA